MDTTAVIRDFNRFYTRWLGLLDDHLPASTVSLPQGRLLYELATGGEQAAADLSRSLSLDKAHVSRLLARLDNMGLISSHDDPHHGKRRLLRLTDAGRSAFATMDAGARDQVEALTAPLSEGDRARLNAAMRTIKRLLAPDAATPAILRPLAAGDLGRVAMRQGIVYHEQFGWNWAYEALVARILADFAEHFDSARDDGWIADQDGEIAGSVFLVRGDKPGVAKLRLLYVEPHARGLGLGRQLVDACVDRARALGYRRLTLWTNDVLVAARRIYEAAGFTLAAKQPHRAFGHDLVSQTWTMPLD